MRVLRTLKNISAVILLTFSVVFATAQPAFAAAFNWTNQTGSGELSAKAWYDAASSASGQYLAAVSLSDAVYVSNDYGVTWTNTSSEHGSLSWVSVSVSETGQYMAAVATSNYVYTSSDYGITWVQRTNSSTRNWFSVDISGSGQDVVAAVQGGYIYTSTDYGDTWTERTGAGSRNWGQIAASADNQYIVVGVVSGGGLYTSSDFGETWGVRASAGSEEWVSLTASSSGQYMAAATWIGNIWTSNDYGLNWVERETSSFSNTQWDDITSSSSGQHIAAATGYGDVYTSADYGATWTNRTPEAPLTELYWQGLALSANGQRLFAAVRNGGLYTANNLSLAPSATTEIPAVPGLPQVMLQTPSGVEVSETEQVAASTLATSDINFTYPLGLVSLCYDTANAQDDITLTFETTLKPNQVVLRNFNEATNTYTTVTDAVITETTVEGRPALQAVYTIVDNGPLDSNSVVGSVCDPIGFALSTFTDVKVPNTGLAPQGSSPIKPEHLAALLLIVTMSLGYILRRRHSTASV